MSSSSPAGARAVSLCKCCYGPNPDFLLTTETRNGDTVPLHLCSSCGALTPDYGPSVEPLGTEHQAKYHHDLWHDESLEVLEQTIGDLHHTVEFYTQYLFRHDLRIAEIGAGRGCLLAALKRAGFAPVGAEPSAGLVEKAQRQLGLTEHEITAQSADEFLSRHEALGTRFDAVFLWHVLEHLEHPVELLRRIAAGLSADGTIIVQVPLPSASNLFPEHRFLCSRAFVFQIAGLVGLKVVQVGVSDAEQFISFVLAGRGAVWPEVEAPRSGMLGTWIADLLRAASPAPAACVRAPSRSETFRDRSHNRYWWYRLQDTDYVPPLYSSLSEAEWSLLDSWFSDTEKRFPSPGEISVPGMSLLAGLIAGNGISRVVQCGHYVGYSTLLLGFLLRAMGKHGSLFSIDIDAGVTHYTQGWLSQAGLTLQVRLSVGSSSSPLMVPAAAGYLGGAPQLVFIDSSHRYRHTLDELDLWYPALAPGGFLLLHDVSRFAATFDDKDGKGVGQALRDWSKRNRVDCFAINDFVDGSQAPSDLVYRDGCGLGLIQKPYGRRQR